MNIRETYNEAITYGMGKLTGTELRFLESIYLPSLAQDCILTPKQEAWFCAIANKLETTKGMLAVQVIGKKHRSKYQRHRESYEIACFGY